MESRPTWRIEGNIGDMDEVAEYFDEAVQAGKGVTLVILNDGALMIRADDTERWIELQNNGRVEVHS